MFILYLKEGAVCHEFLRALDVAVLLEHVLGDHQPQLLPQVVTLCV